jgi:hypothetical protein
MSSTCRLISDVISNIGTDVWNIAGLSSHIVMLSQTCREMKSAVYNELQVPRHAMIIVRPSRLQHVAQRLTLTHVKITDEVGLNTGSNIFQSLPYLTNMVRLDVSELYKRTIDIDILAFCRGLGQYCHSLEHLRLSALFMNAFIDGKGGASWMSLLPELRVLDLRNMNIPTELGHEILVGCNSSVKLEEVNLSDNSLHYLYEILSDQGSLYIKTLKLDFNGLGSVNGFGYVFDEEEEDEEEIEHDVVGLCDLFNDYTSLTALSLTSNAFTNTEGIAIAECLNTNTNLTYLDLRYNFIENDIRQRIRDAWHGEPDNLKL